MEVFDALHGDRDVGFIGVREHPAGERGVDQDHHRQGVLPGDVDRADLQPGRSGRLQLLEADGRPARGVAVRVRDASGRVLPLAVEPALDRALARLQGRPGPA